jgi:hypothetical protein
MEFHFAAEGKKIPSAEEEKSEREGGCRSPEDVKGKPAVRKQ